MPPSPALRRGRASVTPESDSWRSCLAQKRIAQRRRPSACPSSAPPYRRLPTPHRMRWETRLLLKWPRVQAASRNKMMQLIIIARRKPLRHWLNALAIAGSDQPCHIKRTHSPPRFMAQAIQERLEPSSKLVFPIRRCAYHGRPSKSRPPMSHRKNDLGIPYRSTSSKVVLALLWQIIHAACLHRANWNHRPARSY